MRRIAPSGSPPGSLLCVANFPSNTGFAWDFIEGLYGGLAERLYIRGVRTFVAYPRVDDPPAPLRGTPAEAIEHEWDLNTPAGRASAAELLRRIDARGLYLSDRPAWSSAFPGFRRQGVGAIVVHDHTSGRRSQPTGMKRALKWARARVPGMLADHVLCVSDFVVRRKLEVELLPPGRVSRLWNSIEMPPVPTDAERRRVREEMGVDPHRPLVACAARAVPEKGVQHLFRAFDMLWGSYRSPECRPQLVYLGDGPGFGELRDLAATLRSSQDMRLPGYVPRAREVTGAADVAVVPSTWAEAFGLAALEPLAQSVPVVASAVGGLPEVIRDGIDGILVPPGDPRALAEALQRILSDPTLARRMGTEGRARALVTFGRDRQIDALETLFTQLIFE